MRGPILSAIHLGAHSIVRAFVANSIIRPQTGGERENDEWRTRDPSQSLNVGTLNTRRLWLRDHSVHDGFHLLVNLLTDENVDVLCAARGACR